MRRHTLTAGLVVSALLCAVSAQNDTDGPPSGSAPYPRVTEEQADRYENIFERWYETEEGEEAREEFEAGGPHDSEELDELSEELQEIQNTGTTAKLWYRARLQNHDWPTN